MTYFDAPYRPADLTLNSDAINNSCVGFWPLTDGSGSTAVDVSTGGNDATALGTLSHVATSIGTAMEFDGASNGLEVAYDASQQPSEITVSCWFNADDLSTDMKLVSKTESGGWQLGFNSPGDTGNLSFLVRVGASYYYASKATSGLGTGQWYHVVGTYDGSNVRLYIDGVLEDTTAASGTISYTFNNSLGISSEPGQGSGNNASFGFDGNIQNVRIFSSALTAAQVKQLYTRPWTGTNFDTEALWLSPPASPTLSTASQATSIMADIEGWWVMTDGSGTTLTDISGNGRDATLNGTNTWETETLGTANRFDNTSSRTSHAATANTQPDLTSGYTFSTWVKHEEAGLYTQGPSYYGANIVLGDSSGNSDLEIYFNTRAGVNQWPQLVHNRSNGGTTYSSGVEYPNYPTDNPSNDNGVWVHYALTYNGSVAYFYRNATQYSYRYSSAAPLSTSGYKLFINGLPVDGLQSSPTCSMQNTRLYSRALSDSEISLLYERPWIGAEYNESFYLYPPVPSSLTPLDSSSINTDLQGWWPLTETDDFASGAADISGNSNNGTPQSNAGSSNTALGQVLEQPDANSYISVGDVSALKITGALSISIWLKTDSNTPANIVSKYQATTGGRAYSLHLNAPELKFNINGAVVAQGTTQIRGDNKWHHLVGVYDPSNFVRVYVDGVLEGEVTTGVPSSITDTSYPFNIGREWDGGNVVGFLQNCRVWSRALSSTEVADIYYSPWLGSAYTGTSSDPATNRYFSPAAFARLG